MNATGLISNSLGSDLRGSGRERVLFLLKTKGAQTSARMSSELGVTTMAVRQHLAVLEAEKLVDYTIQRREVGRPARVWQLTPKANERFSDGHAELAVGMLQAIQGAFGEQGLDRLTQERTRQQADSYGARMPAQGAPIEERVATLAKMRCEEGYMAELRRGRNGAIELVENHCSIANAARICPQLCASELSLFRTLLGGDVNVDRVEHILSGDRCCAYRITERADPPAVKATR